MYFLVKDICKELGADQGITACGDPHTKPGVQPEPAGFYVGVQQATEPSDGQTLWSTG